MDVLKKLDEKTKQQLLDNLLQIKKAEILEALDLFTEGVFNNDRAKAILFVLEVLANALGTYIAVHACGDGYTRTWDETENVLKQMREEHLNSPQHLEQHANCKDKVVH